MRIGVLLVILLILAGCQTAGNVPARLAAGFDEATFNIAPDRQGLSTKQFNETISRWEEDIYYEVKIDPGLKNIDAQFIYEAMEKFDGLVPVNISPNNNAAAKTNFVIKIANKDQFLINKNQISACYAHLKDAEGFLKEVEITLPGKDIEIAKKCLDHELMHAIGFTGHTHRFRATLSYMHEEYYITKWDKFLIKTLYDDRLKIGMKREKLLPIVDIIIAENYQ